MKPIYSLLIFFALLSFKGLSQDFENSNWVFGESNTLDFLPNPVPGTLALGTGFVGFEGCASVSDRSGNLLLFSDGVRLWHRNSIGTVTQVTDMLKGTPSSAQNIIFVPKPKYPNRYYLFYINGETAGLAAGSLTPSKRGLYYTEVSVDCDVASIIGNVAIPLKDTDGVDVDDIYQNFSESITSALSADGLNYWVVAHIQRIVGANHVGNIVSYKVTENSVGQTDHSPDSNTPLSLLAEEATSIGRCAKISHGKYALTSNRSSLFIADFDIASGLVTITDTIHNANDVYYGVEFSKNGQVLYYTGNNSTNNFIRKVSVPVNMSTLVSNSTGISVCALQMGIDDRIYGSVRDSNTLYTISNASTDDLFADPIFDGSETMINLCRLGLPQKVFRHPCNNTLRDNVDVMSNNLVKSEVSDWIIATNVINVSARVIYHAGNFIELLPEDGSCNPDDHGFEAKLGSEFVAYIADCNTGFNYRGSIVDNTTASNTKKDEVFNNAKIQIFPNPSDRIITVSYSENLRNIKIVSMDGKVMFDQPINASQREIDVSNFAKSIYFMSVETQDGKILNSKFIKN